MTKTQGFHAITFVSVGLWVVWYCTNHDHSRAKMQSQNVDAYMPSNNEVRPASAVVMSLGIVTRDGSAEQPLGEIKISLEEFKTRAEKVTDPDKGPITVYRVTEEGGLRLDYWLPRGDSFKYHTAQILPAPMWKGDDTFIDTTWSYVGNGVWVTSQKWQGFRRVFFLTIGWVCIAVGFVICMYSVVASTRDRRSRAVET